MRTRLAVVAVLVVAAGTLIAARWGGASPHLGTDLTITLTWPTIAPQRSTTHLDCSSTDNPRSRLASVCQQLDAGQAADPLPAVAGKRCRLAPLETRSATIAGWIRGRSVRFALSGCDEPAISGWFGAAGSYAPKPVRPSSPWCPGTPLDPGMPPGVSAPVIVPSRATASSRSPDAVLAAAMRGMAGGLITTAKLHPAGKANHYTRHDSLLELVPRPGPVRTLADDAARSLQWQASWEEEVLQGGLWERLCATANGPVVGSAEVVNGVVRGGAFVEPPDIQAGCGARVITGLTVVDATGRRQTYRVGSAPGCLTA